MKILWTVCNWYHADYTIILASTPSPMREVSHGLCPACIAKAKEEFKVLTNKDLETK